MKFMAVQCFSCSLMQVKQVKKSGNSWCCSVCNEKQSVRQVYATSEAAKDVRIFVQKFNLTRGLAVEAQAVCNLSSGTAEKLQHTSVNSCEEDVEESVQVGAVGAKKFSKWQQFLPDEEQDCAVVWDMLDRASEKFSTALPDTLVDKRENLNSCRTSSSAGGSRGAIRGVRSSVVNAPDDFEARNIFTGDPTFDIGQPQRSFTLKRGRDDGSYDEISPCHTWGLSGAGECPSFVMEDAHADCSPTKFKSGRLAFRDQTIFSAPTQMPRATTSKWSKYLE